MDPQLQEVVKQITDAVDRRVKQITDSVDRRGEQLAEAADRRVEQIADAVDRRIANRLDDAEARLASGAKAHMEELRDLVKVTAEGYGATLDGINRRLDRIEQKVDDGFADQGRVLREHTLQISALKHRVSPPRSSRR